MNMIEPKLLSSQGVKWALSTLAEANPIAAKDLWNHLAALDQKIRAMHCVVRVAMQIWEGGASERALIALDTEVDGYHVYLKKYPQQDAPTGGNS